MPRKSTRRKPTEEELEESRKRILHCADCNILFATTAPHVKYCRKCRVKRAYKRKELEIRICERCGEEYETTRDWSRFCSSHCRNVYHRERYDADLLKEKENGGTVKRASTKA